MVQPLFFGLMDDAVHWRVLVQGAMPGIAHARLARADGIRVVPVSIQAEFCGGFKELAMALSRIASICPGTLSPSLPIRASSAPT